MPIAISVNMLSERATSDFQPRTKNGHPPEHNRRRKNKLDPVRGLLIDQVIEAEQMAAYFEHRHRDRQSGANPESAAHVDQLVAWTFIQGCLLRLQGHPADRTAARTDLPDLRMHGASVDGARGCVGGRLGGFDIAHRLSDELLPALGRAEIVRPASMARTMLCAMRIDLHATDGIRGSRSTMMIKIAMGMTLLVMIMIMM